MKLFTLILMLLPLYAEAAAPVEVEIFCEPNARISLLNRPLRGSIVRLEAQAEKLNGELPWTGREGFTLGRQLREERKRDFDTKASAELDELLNVVQDETRFVTYRGSDKVLFIDEDLLKSNEQDGLVISRQGKAPSHEVTIFHCRSR
jgi:hypothetical protein